MLPVRQLVGNRPRLFVAACIGAALAWALPWHMSLLTRTLWAWNFWVWSYMLLMGWVMIRANHHRVRAIAEREDETAVAVLTVVSIAAILSLAAIVVELGAIKGLPREAWGWHYAFIASTLFGSWFMVGLIFTIHYAHMFYRAAQEQRPLKFPADEQNPDYWDFLYFSFTIAVAVQTSDVAVLTRPMRKAVLAQSVLSFFFNTAVIGLTINIAAGLIGNN
ncbi:MAG: rane protein [Betaproteobacteria bacterium]|nr:rane protein [Betaproteobacteria bacterium]